MKGRPIDQVVYECMFPKPKSTDPQNFQGLLQRQLVPEVRLETQAFYGHLSSQEAKYPGLDYSYQPHRNRLSRYPWHRRLFRAFENLKLTESEIAGLTKWEGTRWAKERFEREQGVVIRDTTADGIEDWVEPELRAPLAQSQRAEVSVMAEIREEEDTLSAEEETPEVDEEMDDDSEPEMQSVGIELNERLIAAAAQREAGNTATIMDEEWEQWLKDAVEAGGIPFLPNSTSSTLDHNLSPTANIPGTRPATTNETQAMHPRVLNAARLGQWHQIPDFLHDMVRQNIENNNRRVENAPPSASTPSPSSPTRFPWTNAANTLRSSVRNIPTSTDSPARRLDRAMVNRLDDHFLEQFSRRPVPRPLSVSGTGIGAGLAAARGRLGRGGGQAQGGS